MRRAAVAFWIALLVHLVIGFFYLVSGLVVPMPPLLLMWAWWLVLLAVLILKRGIPRVLVGIPVVALGSWFLILWFGGRYLGWTA